MRVWLKKKGNYYDIFSIDKDIGFIGKLEKNHALKYQKQPDSCVIGQSDEIEQILCEWDAYMINFYIPSTSTRINSL